MAYDPFGPSYNSSYNPVQWGQSYGPNNITVNPPASSFDPFQYYGSPATDPFGPYKWISPMMSEMPRLPNPVSTTPPPGGGNRQTSPPGTWDLSSALQNAINSLKGGQARWDTVYGKIMGRNPNVFGDYTGELGRDQLEQLIAAANPDTRQAQFLNRLLGQLSDDGGGSPDGGGNGRGNVDRNFMGDSRYRLRELINRLMDDPGFAPDVLDAMRNNARHQNKLTERGLIERRGDEFAARGLFGSGLSRQGVRDIETQAGNQLAGSLTNIDVQNAMAKQRNQFAAIQAIQAAIGREMGLRGIDLQHQLGTGNLDFLYTQLGLDQAFREWMQNMWAAQNTI